MINGIIFQFDLSSRLLASVTSCVGIAALALAEVSNKFWCLIVCLHWPIPRPRQTVGIGSVILFGSVYTEPRPRPIQNFYWFCTHFIGLRVWQCKLTIRPVCLNCVSIPNYFRCQLSLLLTNKPSPTSWSVNHVTRCTTSLSTIGMFGSLLKREIYLIEFNLISMKTWLQEIFEQIINKTWLQNYS